MVRTGTSSKKTYSGMKRCSKSSAVREIQDKTMKHHNTTMKLAKIKKTIQSGVENVQLSRIAGWLVWGTTILENSLAVHLKKIKQPWLVWLSGLSAGLQTKGCWFDPQSGNGPRLQARSPVRSAQDVSLLLFLPPFPSL